MKTCPSCHTQYTDDTLRFCLQDGTPLDLLPVTQQPTVSLSGQELETVARSKISAEDSEVTRWKQKSEVAHATPPSSGSKTLVAVAVTALVMFLVFGVVGLGGWLYLKRSGDEVPRNAANGSTNGNFNAANRTPAVSPSPTPFVVSNKTVPTPVITPPPVQQIDKQAALREVSQQINSWKSLAEAGDLDGYMNKYAGTVDYYRKRSASRSFVRSDKQRAFSMFDSMSVTISNSSVTVDDSGEGATAVFDKEWVFDGARRSTGKVRQQMQFRKINGQWLITGERDLKVYYTN